MKRSWIVYVSLMVAGAAAAGGAGGFPGTAGGAMSAFCAMLGAGAAAGAGAGAAAGFAAGFFSVNSTSARAADTAPASSTVTHTIDERFMTSSFHDVGQLAKL